MANPYTASGARRQPSGDGGLDWLSGLLGAGGDATAKGKRYAGDAWKFLKNNPGKVAGGATALTALLSAAGELSDEDDSLGRNASQAGGNLLGSLSGGAAAGAAAGMIGGPLAPITVPLAAGAGAILGSGVGSNVAGGLYDWATGQTEEERRQSAILREAATQREIMEQDMLVKNRLAAEAMAVERAHKMELAERQLELQKDYNLANTLNASLLNSQQNSAAQQAAMTHYMFN